MNATEASSGRHVVGWKLDREERGQLLRRFAPRWPDVIADHVTLSSDPGEPLPVDTHGEIVGHVDDDAGLQALVVRIGGTTDRPDGSHYHITWSLDRAREREAVESNAVIAAMGWQEIRPAVPITLIPCRF